MFSINSFLPLLLWADPFTSLVEMLIKMHGRKQCMTAKMHVVGQFVHWLILPHFPLAYQILIKTRLVLIQFNGYGFHH